MNKLVIVAAFLMLAGCGDNPEQQEEDIRDYFSDNRFGESTDYMLSRRGVVFRNERFGVMIFFGFADNLSSCEEIADMWNAEEPDTYDCERLN